MTQPTADQAKDLRVALFCAAQLREAAHARIVQSFGKFAQGQGPGPTDDDLRLFAKLVAQERRLQAGAPVPQRAAPASLQPSEQPASWKPGASAAYAYGGLADLARMRFRTSRNQSSVCDACSTINRSSALLCKGCSRKMPAFYAKEASMSTPPASPLPRQQRKRMHIAAAALLSFGLFTLVLGGAGIAHFSDAPSSKVASASQAAAPSLTAPTSPRDLSRERANNAPRIAETAPTEMVSPAGSSPTAAAYGASPGARAMTVSSVEPRIDDVPVSAKPEPFGSAKQVLSLPKPPTRPAASRPSDRSIRSALAECDGLNFLSNAICMNNKCADRKIGRSAQCIEPLRQRKLDEARRNPTLVG